MDISLDWWQSYFDHDYLRFHEGRPYQDTARELQMLNSLLGKGEGKKLLDACCGYGRHSIPLAEQGWEVVGLDYSHFLLSELGKRKKGDVPQLVQADLRNPPFPENLFHAVICMFTSIGYLLENEESQKMVDSLSHVLRNDGICIVDLANRDFLLKYPAVIRNWWEKEGAMILEETEFDPYSSVALTRNTWIKGAEKNKTGYFIRLFSVHEVLNMVAQAGLTIESVYGNYDGSAFRIDQPRIIIKARKVADSTETRRLSG